MHESSAIARTQCCICSEKLPEDRLLFHRNTRMKCAECFAKAKICAQREIGERSKEYKAKAQVYRDRRKHKKSEYEKQNPWLSAARKVQRAHSSKRAIPVWAADEFEQFAIREASRLVGLRSRLTGIKHHLDHIVPLQGKTVSGLHCIANVAVIPARMNISKGNRYWPDMP